MKNLIQAAVVILHSVSVAQVASADGALVAWGVNVDGQCTPPAFLGSVRAVAGAWSHSVALRPDGTVAAWGGNVFGQTNVPIEARDIVQISAGGGHSLALRRDGRVFGWPGTPGGPDYCAGCIPTVASFAKYVSAGDDGHSAVILPNDRVFAWGRCIDGQCAVPVELGPAIRVAAGGVHTLALRADGRVFAWGYNGVGQCEVPANLGTVREIAASRQGSVALQVDGTVVGWGELSIPADLVDVSRVDRLLAVRSDGSVVSLDGSAVGAAVPVTGVSAGWSFNGVHGLAVACGLNMRTFISPNLGSFGAFQPRQHTFTGMPTLAGGDVELAIDARGDLDLASEFLSVRVNGQPVGTVFGLAGEAVDCPPSFDRGLLRLSASTYSSFAATGTLTVRVESSIGVDVAQCAESGLIITVSVPELYRDCDGNGRHDTCDISLNPALDCDSDGVIDECTGDSHFIDCDGNLTADRCEIVLNQTLDCDHDLVLDSCQIAANASLDCDGNGILDSCDVYYGAQDKNGDGKPDGCSFVIGDFNLDGVVDGVDLGVLLGLWGQVRPPYGDLNGDSVVDGIDLGRLLGHWGTR